MSTDEQPRSSHLTERDLKECRVCRWPHPLDNDHYICPCCGTHASYEDWTREEYNSVPGRPPLPENQRDGVERCRDIWGGNWRSGVREAPLIIQRLQKLLDDAVQVHTSRERESAQAEERLVKAYDLERYKVRQLAKKLAEVEAELTTLRADRQHLLDTCVPIQELEALRSERQDTRAKLEAAFKAGVIWQGGTESQAVVGAHVYVNTHLSPRKSS